jgi:phospho-N-acetylmuramoyl-pentapeptide-transferase
MVDEFIRPLIDPVTLCSYAFITFIIGLLLTPWFRKFQAKYKLGKKMRVAAMDGADASVFLKYHEHKFGTPTMGGILIWIAIIVTIILSRVLAWADVVEFSLLQRKEVYLPLFTLTTMGILGMVDDYFNIRGIGKNKGLDSIPKLITMFAIAIIGAWWFYFKLGHSAVTMPITGTVIDLGWVYIPLFILVMVSVANAVNFTDGLDGLAGGLLILAYAAYGVIAYFMGLTVLAAFCAVVVGATGAFLWNNVPKALFYMGDTGSMALGGCLAVIAMMTDQLIVLPIVGIVFLVELLSVVIQLTSKRLRGGKKVFRSAPIHHHFEALDWGESKVTMRFWIVGALGAVGGILIALM